MKVLACALGGLTAFALVLGLCLFGASAGSLADADAAIDQLCVSSGPVAGLSSVAAANARAVVATADQAAGVDGAVIAVMVGYTESGLRSLTNPNVVGSPDVGEGTGTNFDSVGIFQQRASWGSVAQRLDPVASTQLFVTRLLGDTGWPSKQPWVAAQDVQGSAYDGVPRAANHFNATYGGNYQANYELARNVVEQITGVTSVDACGTLTGGLPANTAPGSHGLPADYVIPRSATPPEATVLEFAIAQLGKAYVWGAAGPDSFDCSGLTMAAWAEAGVTLPHRAADQAASGTPTVVGALAPGDLVLVPGDDGTLAAPGHVGLYLGDGLVLNAADPSDGIHVQTYANFVQVGHGLAALRHIE